MTEDSKVIEFLESLVKPRSDLTDEAFIRTAHAPNRLTPPRHNPHGANRPPIQVASRSNVNAPAYTPTVESAGRCSQYPSTDRVDLRGGRQHDDTSQFARSGLLTSPLVKQEHSGTTPGMPVYRPNGYVKHEPREPMDFSTALQPSDLEPPTGQYNLQLAGNAVNWLTEICSKRGLKQQFRNDAGTKPPFWFNLQVGKDRFSHVKGQPSKILAKEAVAECALRKLAPELFPGEARRNKRKKRNGSLPTPNESEDWVSFLHARMQALNKPPPQYTTFITTKPPILRRCSVFISQRPKQPFESKVFELERDAKRDAAREAELFLRRQDLPLQRLDNGFKRLKPSEPTQNMWQRNATNGGHLLAETILAGLDTAKIVDSIQHAVYSAATQPQYGENGFGPEYMNNSATQPMEDQHNLCVSLGQRVNALASELGFKEPRFCTVEKAGGKADCAAFFDIADQSHEPRLRGSVATVRNVDGERAKVICLNSTITLLEQLRDGRKIWRTCLRMAPDGTAPLPSEIRETSGAVAPIEATEAVQVSCSPLTDTVANSELAPSTSNV